MSKKYKDRYLPVEVIIAATQGEAAAIQTVLKTYESYIRNKCIKTVYDERGLVYYGIDTDQKRLHGTPLNSCCRGEFQDRQIRREYRQGQSEKS